MPVNYQGGKIYTIRAPETNKYYIGSTAQTLPKRFSDHKAKFKLYQNGKHHNVTSFKILELQDTYIELLEIYPCNSKAELERREGQLIREHKDNCVNRCIVGRTKKEHYEDNKEQILEKQREYYTANKETINAKNREYQLANKETIEAKQAEKVQCECGAFVSRRNISRHRKLQKHQKAMKEETD